MQWLCACGCGIRLISDTSQITMTITWVRTSVLLVRVLCMRYVCFYLSKSRKESRLQHTSECQWHNIMGYFSHLTDVIDAVNVILSRDEKRSLLCSKQFLFFKKILLLLFYLLQETDTFDRFHHIQGKLRYFI